MIDERRAMEAQGVVRNDLFSGLIRASDNEQGNAKLSKAELLADIHVFLLAGHETTARSLMAVLMLLALYPENQARIVQEARDAFGEDGEDHGFEKYSHLVSDPSRATASLAELKISLVILEIHHGNFHGRAAPFPVGQHCPQGRDQARPDHAPHHPRQGRRRAPAGPHLPHRGHLHSLRRHRALLQWYVPRPWITSTGALTGS